MLETGGENIVPYMEEEYVNERYRQIQKGYQGTQWIRVRSGDLQRTTTAYMDIIQLVSVGKPVVYNSPDYLVSDLETIKMSLIGAATQKALLRAEELAKVGNIAVGTMRAASQGVFYILPALFQCESQRLWRRLRQDDH